MFALIASLLIAPASAQESKLKKAQKFYDKFDGTEVFLQKAYDNVVLARDHIDTRDQARTWMLYGDLAREFALDPELKGPFDNPLQQAIGAYDTALGKDGATQYHEHILEGVLTLESVMNSQLIDAYEREDNEVAWALVPPLIQAHGIVRQIGRLDPAREIAVLQYATLTALRLGKLGEAVQRHKELDAVGGRKSGTTMAVADALESEDPARALKFLTRWSKEAPSDAVLLQARFDLLFAEDKGDEVRALLKEYAGDRGSAIAITLVHARALDKLQATEEARETYAKAHQLEPTNQEVLREYADLEVRRADALGTGRRERKQVAEILDHAIELLQALVELDPDDLATHETLLALYQRTKSKDTEAIAKVNKRIEALR